MCSRSAEGAKGGGRGGRAGGMRKGGAPLHLKEHFVDVALALLLRLRRLEDRRRLRWGEPDVRL